MPSPSQLHDGSSYMKPKEKDSPLERLLKYHTGQLRRPAARLAVLRHVAETTGESYDDMVSCYEDKELKKSGKVGPTKERARIGRLMKEARLEMAAERVGQCA